jgi:polyphosphate kinase
MELRNPSQAHLFEGQPEPTPDIAAAAPSTSSTKVVTRPSQTAATLSAMNDRVGEPRTASGKPAPTSPIRLLNRELGILAFNERVFTLAEDGSVPLLERLRFLTIVASNLDEFYEVRVAELKEIAYATSGDAQTARAHIAVIAARANHLIARQYRLLNDVLMPQLASEGIVFLMSAAWTPAQRAWAENVFVTNIEPILTPIALDPAHPFPRVLNKSLNFVVELHGQDAFGRKAQVAIVQAPRALPRILKVPTEVSGVRDGVMLLTSVVQGFVGRLFPGMTIASINQFRVTRNSELFVDDEDITDLRSALQGELPQRHFGDTVRLEVTMGCPDVVIARLLSVLELSETDSFRVDGPVNLSRLAQLIDLVDREDLKFVPYGPSVPAGVHDRELFVTLRKCDVLLHHPYESFTPVMEFLSSAAVDPQVVAIRQTVYRTGADSVLMESLVKAAQAGKEVTVVVELMARFDEETNINWAERLERAGAHVVYGVVGHKTHAKMAMVIRREADGLRRYVHLGTGNYHPRTARLYEDFGLFTANEAICADVHEIFRRLTGVGQAGALSCLLQAPFTLHSDMLTAIRREAQHARAGKRGYLAVKVNALLDSRIIDALYEASAAGVKMDLLVRGVCALRPGIAGLSSNIRVRSVVGRFLEHSRVFYFWNDGKRDVWLSSADWMERNFHRRVEIAFPILDRRLKLRVIREALTEHLADNTSAWTMDCDGRYTRRKAAGRGRRISQQRLMQMHNLPQPKN